MGCNLMSALETLIAVFHSYSGKEGDKYKLSKAELKTLINGELGQLISTSNDAKAVDDIMRDLDLNKDGEVDFQEFVLLVAVLTVACNQFFTEYQEGKKCSK